MIELDLFEVAFSSSAVRNSGLTRSVYVGGHKFYNLCLRTTTLFFDSDLRFELIFLLVQVNVYLYRYFNMREKSERLRTTLPVISTTRNIKLLYCLTK